MSATLAVQTGQAPILPVIRRPAESADRIPAPPRRSVAWSKTATHQGQYDDPVSRFFQVFSQNTGRDSLYTGYIHGHIINNPQLTEGDSLAVDFGCGTGWLTPFLAHKFTHVCGIDPSKAMLTIAIASHATPAGRITFHESPEEMFRQPPGNGIKGKCNFVSALHVHYHFNTKQKLRDEFFKAAANMLKPNGELLLIGCPSDHIHKTPAHYTNHIHKDDVPSGLRISQPSLLADEDGFIALHKLPAYPLVDGTQMKVVFRTFDHRGRETANVALTDTYWSDAALIEAASEAGLRLERRETMQLRDHPDAYMAMHFRKMESGIHL